MCLLSCSLGQTEQQGKRVTYLTGSTEAGGLPRSGGLPLREVEAGVGAFDGQGCFVILLGCLLSCVKGTQPQPNVFGGVPDLRCILPPWSQSHTPVPVRVVQESYRSNSGCMVLSEFNSFCPHPGDRPTCLPTVLTRLTYCADIIAHAFQVLRRKLILRVSVVLASGVHFGPAVLSQRGS